ncbi:hypothetical protein ACH5RR_007000 [Cinchona calisaya]|uniref:Uncharacterized protein n=1 Tax=Cinchona calisaya TaxID=153742 RepID=A0ABD3AR14_9GENT
MLVKNEGKGNGCWRRKRDRATCGRLRRVARSEGELERGNVREMGDEFERNVPGLIRGRDGSDGPYTDASHMDSIVRCQHYVEIPNISHAHFWTSKAILFPLLLFISERFLGFK